MNRINQAVKIAYHHNMAKRITDGVIKQSKRGYKLLTSPGFNPVCVTEMIKNLKQHGELSLADMLKEKAH